MESDQVDIESADVAAKLRRAFPARLTNDVDQVIENISGARVYSPFDVSVSGEMVSIPYRMSYQPKRPYGFPINWMLFHPDKYVARLTKEVSEMSLTGVPRQILACLMTRHRCGFIRQHFLYELADTADFWVAPYVFSLISDHVLEVVETLLVRIESFDTRMMVDFAVTNRELLDRTRQRVVSYWDTLYRGRCASLSDYPGFRVLNTLGLWPKRYARRLRRL